MDVILIPGFWLDASSWHPVVGPLEEAGHTVYPLTLPGMESQDADRSGIGLRDHVDAVIAVVDTLPAGVVLVGHSGGGAIAHAVVDARPDAIARVVYVDSGPLGDGGVINDELPVVNGEIPLPEWGVFEDEDLVDLTEELRAEFARVAIPQPARVASDKQQLRDPRRYEVPVTLICCEMPSSTFLDLLAEDHPWVAELATIKDREFIDLRTGHWPQFTRPAELAKVLVGAMRA
ncbi:MAG TPA: alpha/beta hydrolase [Terrimesophilobacter sp.]|nr:alpha/beta hydrolase [Terrimesophilobacter sp.]HRP99484.1 alpha/beta hydrolase [Terrimesophilobacter sp.]